MKINLRRSAIKDLNKIPIKFRLKIHDAIANLVNFPNIENCKKLTNFEPAYRIRVGNYRVLFDVVDNVVVIGRVLHRKDSYTKRF